MAKTNENANDSFHARMRRGTEVPTHANSTALIANEEKTPKRGMRLWSNMRMPLSLELSA